MIFTGDIAQPNQGASIFSVPNNLKEKVWVGNLEGSLIETGKTAEKPGGVYNDLKAIQEVLEYIPFRSFILGNNHLLDAASVQTTIENLKKLRVGLVGAGTDIDDARKSITTKDSDETIYRILAFGWANIQCIPATKTSGGVNPYTKANVFKSVSEALKQVEPLLCFFHWNYELEKYPQPYDRHLAHELIDMGVAAVIGCHAHRVQPIEFYKGKPIVYGLGNFLFCQGHFFDGKLRFPKFCEEEYAFEINKNGFKLHYFFYDQKDNRLDYVKSVEIGEDKVFDGKAEFTGYSDKEYEKWFKAHRIQKKMLPIFHARENELSYWMKSKWIKFRGGIINQLTKINLKSANRANR